MRQSRIILGILTIILSISCIDKNPIVADGIFDREKLDVVKDSIVGIDIEAYSISNAGAYTSPVINGIIGVHNDKIFGKTKASTVFQLRIPGRFIFEEEASNGVDKTIDDMTVDSAFLFLTYDQVYFDSVTLQNLNVYRVNRGLDISENYKADEEYKIERGDLLANKEFNYAKIVDTTITRDTTVYDDIKSKIDPEQDSILIKIDTLISPALRIVLDSEEARDMFMTKEAESNYDSQESFLSYFNGIYIEVDDFSDEGGIYSFNISNGKKVTSSYTDKTRIDMFYSYKEILEGVSGDSIVTRRRQFRISTNENSARVNFMEHNYSGSEMEGKIGDKEDVVESEKVYIKGAAGTMAKIYIDDINNWSDSTDIAINSAILVLKCDRDTAYYNTNTPTDLGLAVYNEADGELVEEPVILSKAKYSKYVNGYEFDISLYLQSLIREKGRLKSKSFIVYSVNRSEDPRGIVIANPKVNKTEDKRIKLSITYTKIK